MSGKNPYHKGTWEVLDSFYETMLEQKLEYEGLEYEGGRNNENYLPYYYAALRDVSSSHPDFTFENEEIDLDTKDLWVKEKQEELSKFEKVQDKKKNNLNIEREIEKHSKELNDFIDRNVTNEIDNSSLLTMNELEGILNDHFKRVEAVLHDYNNQNIDADTFKNKLESLTNHVKSNTRLQFPNAKKTNTKSITNLKKHAKNKINKFVKNINSHLQNTSLDRIINDHMETLSKHIQESEMELNKLNNLNANNPKDQHKLNELKNKLSSHISSAKEKKDELSSLHSNNKSLSQTNEEKNDKKVKKASKKSIDVSLER